MDTVGVLSASTAINLQTSLEQLEAEDGTQIAVLIIPTLNGESLEEYTLRVAETWKLGQEDKDNGALLLVAIEDREMRIEVGYGLEDRLTDLMTGRIITERIIPAFRNGDLDSGVQAGVEAMISAARGENPFVGAAAGNASDIAPLAGTSSDHTEKDTEEGNLVIALAGLSVLFGLVFGKFLISAGLGAAIGAGFGLLLPYDYAPLTAAGIGAFCALMGVVFRRQFTGGGFGGGSSGGGGGSGGGGSSGYRSSRSSSSGGFSGRGGSFGGGGASGKW